MSRQAVTVWVNLENLARLDEMAKALNRSRSGHAGLLLGSAIEEKWARQQREKPSTNAQVTANG